jgi:hypothetical protein
VLGYGQGTHGAEATIVYGCSVQAWETIGAALRVDGGVVRAIV